MIGTEGTGGAGVENWSGEALPVGVVVAGAGVVDGCVVFGGGGVVIQGGCTHGLGAVKTIISTIILRMLTVNDKVN